MSRKMQLRDYQDILYNKITQSSVRYDLAVLPTGGGKTPIFSKALQETDGHSCAIAHRQELVTQMSLTLARFGVKHSVIAPPAVVKLASRLHTDEVGQSFIRPNALCSVAGVDTLVARKDNLDDWVKKVKFWAIDEAHHVLRTNKWGKAVELFTNARGLGVTATPLRADGNGLGAHADGVFESLILGPSMRELIDRGYLCDYRIFAPPSDLDLTNVPTSKATGDYTKPKMVAAIKDSHIVGDVVNHYLRIARGKQGITFVTDVETAKNVAAQFNKAGVRAVAVDAKTPEQERQKAIRQFRNKELQQLVNVDLFGEGFDVPGVEVVSMARPTQSFGLYSQQFGRALRLAVGKAYAIIIDHVGNVTRHGLPDAGRVWTLDRRERRASTAPTDAVPVTTCKNIECMAVYEKVYAACPYCGYKPVPMKRSGPEFVDGDLTELDPATLSRMRGEVARVDMSIEALFSDMHVRNIPKIGQGPEIQRHQARAAAQVGLRDTIALWAGHQRAAGKPDSESYRRFYFKFGVDVLTAKTLKAKDAIELTKRINGELLR